MEGGEADGERSRGGREGRVGAWGRRRWQRSGRREPGPQGRAGGGERTRGEPAEGRAQRGEAGPSRPRPQEERQKWGKEEGRGGDRWQHGVWGQEPREGGGGGARESRQATELPRRRRRWRSGAETQQGKRQTERERVRDSWRKATGQGEGGGRGRAAGSYLLCHLSHGLDAGSIQVAVVLAGLDELVCLDVLLHFLPGRHKVVIPAIYLILPLGPCRICREVTPAPKELTAIRLASALPSAQPQMPAEGGRAASPPHHHRRVLQIPALGWSAQDVRVT